MVQDDLLKNLLSKLVRVEDISYAPDEQVFANCSLIGRTWVLASEDIFDCLECNLLGFSSGVKIGSECNSVTILMKNAGPSPDASRTRRICPLMLLAV